MSKYSDRLKSLRNQAGLSQAELAKRFGIAKSTISMYECGVREPNIEMLNRFATFFNVSVGFLTGGYDTVSPEVLAEWEQKYNPDGKLAREIRVMEDIEKCYGKSAYEAAALYSQLDKEDQAEIRGEMRGMLKAEKYASKQDDLADI